jgi:hypothetical protein
MLRFLIPFSKTRDETPTKRQRLGEDSSLPPGVPASLAEVHESVNADVSSSNGSSSFPALLPLIRQLGVGEGSSLPAVLPLIRPLVAAEVQGGGGGGGGSHFSPQSGNVVTSSNSPESLGLMGNRNFPKPLRNPSVKELKARLRDLHANASLHVAKIGQAYSDRADARMTGNHYHGDWYARLQGQILADGIEDDAHAILLEQAGIDFMTQHNNLCLNEQKAGLPRMPGQDGYSVSRTGVVYYMPLHPRLTREDYFHTLTGHKSYYQQTQGGGLKAQGTDLYSLKSDKFSLKSDKHSLGTSKHALGTSKHALGTSKNALGTSKNALGTSKHALGTSKYALGTSKNALGTSKYALGTSKQAQGTAKEVSPEGK